MLAASRQRAVLDLLQQHGSISVADLCARFGVSSNTARRDLRVLERDRLVTLVHGGAILNNARDTEVPFTKRRTSSTREKALIGARAAQLVRDGTAVSIDAGTTCHEVAKALRSRTDLTVVTNALNVAQELADCLGIVTIVSGGVARGKSYCLVGPGAERTFQEWRVDEAFLSAGGVDLEVGLTNPNPFEVPIKQAMIKAARHVTLVITSDNLGRRSLVPFARIEAVHTIVTDSRISAGLASDIRALGIELIVVEVDG